MSTLRRSKRNSQDAATPASKPPHVSRKPWPRIEGTPIKSTKFWDNEPAVETLSSNCVDRPCHSMWDEYDTLFYNAWLTMDIQPTRVACLDALENMGIAAEVEECLQKIGLGTMCTTFYKLYPDLVRQFFASVRVFYTGTENLKTAKDGKLAFMLRGRRYEMSFQCLCRIYGFREDAAGVEIPTEFPDQQVFWSNFGIGDYDARMSTQADIRHPVLRYLAKLLGSTFLCKSEVAKMRLQELVLLHYAVGHLVRHDYAKPFPAQHDINLGAVFAHHLANLQRKPFTDKRKKENIGSLLTPIFEYCGIDLTTAHVISKKDLLGAANLKFAGMITGKWLYVFNDLTGTHHIQLPQPHLTSISTQATLRFEPSNELCTNAPSTRKRKRPRTSTTPSSTAAPLCLPYETTIPQVPVDLTNDLAFRQYVDSSLQKLWSAVNAIPRCACTQPHHQQQADTSTSDYNASEEDIFDHNVSEEDTFDVPPLPRFSRF